jgi:hypothetical protein
MKRDRICHALRKAGATQGPANWIFVDTETWPVGQGARHATVKHKFRLGVACGLRLHRGDVSREKWLNFHDASEFWAFVTDRCHKRMPLWIAAHNLHFDFRVLGGFEILEGLNHREWKLVTRDPPTVFKGKLNGYSVCFVDTLNYFRCPASELGRSVGRPKKDMPWWWAPDKDWFAYCRRDVEIVAQGILELIRFQRQNDTGPWGSTLPQLAFNAYRRHHMPAPIYLHDNKCATELERASYFGGRCDCYFVGTAPGPHYLVDANSLYPAVMRGQLHPRRLIHTFDSVRPEQAHSWLRDRGLIAEVSIQTREREYPVRVGRQPWYVTGALKTTLAGPELERALENGDVVKVHRCALYELGELFTSYVDYFWELRQKYRNSGQVAFEMMCKLFLNSLFGKWVQKRPEYAEDVHRPAPGLWETWIYRDLITETRREMRSFAGVVQELVSEGEPWHSFPAIGSYITARARCLMDDCKAVAGWGHYLYEDTDALIVDQEGFDRLYLAGLIHPRRLGAFKLVRYADSCEIRSAKDYTLGDWQKRKGIKRDATALPDGTVLQDHWSSCEGSWRRRAEPTIEVVRSPRRPSGPYQKRDIGDSGWTHAITAEHAHFLSANRTALFRQSRAEAVARAVPF